MVKESNSKIYTSRLPAPSMYGVTAGSSPAYKSSKMTRSDNRIPREEQVQEILELKKALAKTRQDLQKTRSRRQSQDARSSSDEEPFRREEMGSSMTGSMSGMSAISNKPCLNRELVAKLRSMTETIKMLSTENVALREENDQLVSGRDIRSRDGDDSQEVLKLRASIKSYENQISELGDKVKNLENEMEAREKQASQQPPPEKEKYKSLAKRLKEERNQYKEMVEDKKKEQDELKVEIEKMTEIIGDLRDNCGKLQEELLQVRLDSPRQCQDRGIQTTPMTRRASFGGADTTVRAKITPKRTRSTMSPAPVVPSSPRQYQMNRTNELSKPKIRNNNNNSNSSSVPNSPARGPRIVKPVQRSSVPSPKSCPSPKPSPIRTRSASASASSSPSKIPSMSKIPTPNKSRIPLKSSQQQQRSREEVDDNHDEMLFISEEGQTTSDDGMEVESRSSSQPRHESNTMEIESSVVHDEDDDFPPPPIAEETGDDHDDLPAPPPPADLEKLSLEAAGVHDEVDPMITTPRTLRRADSMRQRVAARRIQRTWKHFYQELEEKKTDIQEAQTVANTDNTAGGDDVDAAIADVQASVISHGARVASLAAARARGGIYTARPWMAGKDSETESENEDLIENLQGLIRSHSLRLKTLKEEEDVFRVGKVSSIRAKFSRRSPDGASDDYLADSDRNV